MINKIFGSAKDIVTDIQDGSIIAIGGFGGSGMPNQLIDALIEQGAKDLTIVSNNAGNGDQGLAALLKAKRVKKLICSFPRQKDAYVFEELYRNNEIRTLKLYSSRYACRTFKSCWLRYRWVLYTYSFMVPTFRK